MKSSVLVFLAINFQFVALNEILRVRASDNSVALEAAKRILVEQLAKHNSKVDVVYFGQKGGYSEDFAEQILRQVPAQISVKSSRANVQQYQFKVSTLAIYDSFENFKETFNKTKWLSDGRFRYKHLLHIPNMNVTLLDEFFMKGQRNKSIDPFDNIEFDNIDFLINESESSIDVVTGYFFSASGCRFMEIKTINRFDKISSQWKTEIFYPKKYQNLYGCKMIFLRMLPGRELPLSMKNDGHVINLLSKTQNFTVHDSNAVEFKDLDSKRSLSVGFRANRAIMTFNGVFSVVVGFYSCHFTYPPGAPYTQFEKMFLMFDVEFWIAIGTTIVVAICLIQIINLLPRSVQNFVYGRNIQTPMMNLLQIFLVGGQNRLPGRNFARFHVVMFIIWSLIIRTCYQSMLYQYLQNDLRKPPFTTIDREQPGATRGEQLYLLRCEIPKGHRHRERNEN